MLLVFVSALIAAACSTGVGGDGSEATGSESTPETGYENVQPDDLARMLSEKGVLLINVHVPYEGEIDGTDLFVPYNEIEQNLDRLPADTQAKIVLYCRSGAMSETAANTLVRLGYTNIWNLEGGMIAWEAAGYPLVQRQGAIERFQH